jgi:DNA invertase Pin-like site-specific DNA recombinase
VPLAFSYCRTSTARQARAERSGIERQEEALARWLADHPGYALQEALVDAGVSAGRGKNRTTGALARFINGGRTGAIPPGSCLVVESMSRFTRRADSKSVPRSLAGAVSMG